MLQKKIRQRTFLEKKKKKKKNGGLITATMCHRLEINKIATAEADETNKPSALSMAWRIIKGVVTNPLVGMVLVGLVINLVCTGPSSLSVKDYYT